MTEAGVRQHLDALAEHGLVVSRPGAAEGRGRPPTVWALTDLAQDLFPDRHDDLTVELHHRGAHRARRPGPRPRHRRARRGAARRVRARGAQARRRCARASRRSRGIRTDEGYVAEVARRSRRRRRACCSSSTTARSAPPRARVPGCAVRSSRCSARCSARRCRSSARSTSSAATAVARIASSPCRGAPGGATR